MNKMVKLWVCYPSSLCHTEALRAHLLRVRQTLPTAAVGAEGRRVNVAREMAAWLGRGDLASLWLCSAVARGAIAASRRRGGRRGTATGTLVLSVRGPFPPAWAVALGLAESKSRADLCLLVTFPQMWQSIISIGLSRSTAAVERCVASPSTRPCTGSGAAGLCPSQA